MTHFIVSGVENSQLKVNIMNTEKYEANLTKIREWMKMNDAGSLGVVLEAQIALPVENDDDRDRVWTAIRAIAKMLPNSPIRPGAASKLSPEVQATLDSISNGVRTAARSYFNAGMGNLLRMHGKSGGGLYADADEFAEAEAKKIVNDLKRRMRENIWDGTIEGLSTQTFPVLEVNEEE